MKTTLDSIWQQIAGAVGPAWDGIRSAVISAVNSIVSAARSAGASMAEAFADGIRSRLDAAYSAAKEMVDKIRNLLPGSDAKEGPLSDLTASGKALADTFRLGVESGTPSLQKSMRAALAGVQLSPNVALTGSGSSGAAPVSSTSADNSQHISIYVGQNVDRGNAYAGVQAAIFELQRANLL
jgi:phage-related protein